MSEHKGPELVGGVINEAPRLPVYITPASAVRGAGAGAIAGAGVTALIYTLLQGQPQVVAQLIGWGPGLLIVAGFLWLASSYAPPFIDSQRGIAQGMGRLADTVERTAGSQHDLVLAMQVNSDKLEQVRDTVAELQSQVVAHLGQERP